MLLFFFFLVARGSASSIDSMDVRHACLLRAISMGGLGDPSSGRANARCLCSEPPSRLHIRGAPATTTLSSALRRRFNICERNSESDRFVIPRRPRLEEFLHSASILPSTNLGATLRRFCSRRVAILSRSRWTRYRLSLRHERELSLCSHDYFTVNHVKRII